MFNLISYPIARCVKLSESQSVIGKLTNYNASVLQTVKLQLKSLCSVCVLMAFINADYVIGVPNEFERFK